MYLAEAEEAARPALVLTSSDLRRAPGAVFRELAAGLGAARVDDAGARASLCWILPDSFQVRQFISEWLGTDVELFPAPGEAADALAGS